MSTRIKNFRYVRKMCMPNKSAVLNQFAVFWSKFCTYRAPKLVFKKYQIACKVYSKVTKMSCLRVTARSSGFRFSWQLREKYFHSSRAKYAISIILLSFLSQNSSQTITKSVTEVPQPSEICDFIDFSFASLGHHFFVIFQRIVGVPKCTKFWQIIERLAV